MVLQLWCSFDCVMHKERITLTLIFLYMADIVMKPIEQAAKLVGQPVVWLHRESTQLSFQMYVKTINASFDLPLQRRISLRFNTDQLQFSIVHILNQVVCANKNLSSADCPYEPDITQAFSWGNEELVEDGIFAISVSKSFASVSVQDVTAISVHRRLRHHATFHLELSINFIDKWWLDMIDRHYNFINDHKFGWVWNKSQWGSVMTYEPQKCACKEWRFRKDFRSYL